MLVVHHYVPKFGLKALYYVRYVMMILKEISIRKICGQLVS